MKSERFIEKERLIEIIIIATGLLLSFMFSLSYPGQLIHKKMFDIFMSAKPKPAEWDKILYVDVNNETIDYLGRWPWSRQVIGEGVEYLKEFNADKILFDIEFIDPSDMLLNKEYVDVIQSMYMGEPLSNVWSYLITEPDNELLTSMVVDNDKNVYLACRGTDTSLKESADIENDSWQQISMFADDFFIPITDYDITNKLLSDDFLEFPTFPLFLGAAGMGYTLVDYDELDGVLRRVSLFRLFGDYIIPQLTLPVLFDELGVIETNIVIEPGRHIILNLTNGESIKIPVDKDGRMIVNWSGRWEDSFQHIGFHELFQYQELYEYVMSLIAYAETSDLTEEQQAILMENRQSLMASMEYLQSAIEDKIVIIGVSAISVDDFGPIAIQPITPMVITHANIMNTIYQQDFIVDAPFYVNWLLILALIFTLVIIGQKIKSAGQETLYSGIIIVLLLVIDYILIAYFGIVLNYSQTLTALLVSFVALIVFKFILYDKQKNFIKSAFMSYLSPDVVQQVIENPDVLKLGGKRMEITAYFSDVQGFTSISENLSPEDIVHLLNEYLTAMSDIILSYGGTVDKYEGDAVVAFFGAPIAHSDHALRCCNASIDMQNALLELREKWKNEGFPEIKARMGMNTGFAIIGNMGSQQRMNYTMMGDTVNLAARLEGANKAYGTYTMISEETYKKVSSKMICRKLDCLRVVGKNEPVVVYELVGRINEVDSKLSEILKLYDNGMNEYDNREWPKAYELFKSIWEIHKDPPSKAYMERCAQFMKNPPSKDWDGVFILRNK